MQCYGIGSKINDADCIYTVFSLEKLEAFPIDVWVRRALGEWYFPGEKQTRLTENFWPGPRASEATSANTPVTPSSID